jgi:copper chaperone CopZ
MLTRRYRTNLHCGSCVSAVKPFLDSAEGVEDWNVDTDSPDKVLTVRSDTLRPEAVRDLVARAGFQVLGELPGENGNRSAESPPSRGETDSRIAARAATYYPLALLILFLLGGTALLQMRAGTFHAMHAMNDFMGLFFVAFAFFKLLDLPGFASGFAGYDTIARRWTGWGYLYPFVELALGVAYLVRWQPLTINIVTLIVLSISSVGVLRALLDRRAIRCACLGTVFNLPMTTVSLAEDVGMAVMAAAMILAGLS